MALSRPAHRKHLLHVSCHGKYYIHERERRKENQGTGRTKKAWFAVMVALWLAAHLENISLLQCGGNCKCVNPFYRFLRVKLCEGARTQPKWDTRKEQNEQWWPDRTSPSGRRCQEPSAWGREPWVLVPALHPTGQASHPVWASVSTSNSGRVCV